MVKQCYRVKEAAEFLGVSKSCVWNYAKQGLIKPVKLSMRVTVFNIEDLTALAGGVSKGKVKL